MKKKEDSLYKSYMDSIRKIPLLSTDEERKLAVKITAGHEGARKKLIEANLRIVIKIARKYNNPNLTLMDLIQEGNLGLMHAVTKYDLNKNVRFCSYAVHWIKHSIIRAIRTKQRMIRIPIRKEQCLAKIQRTRQLLYEDRLKKPTTTEVAEKLGTPEKKVIEIENLPKDVLSIDKKINTNEGTINDILKDNTYRPEQAFFTKELKKETIHFLNLLKQREKQVILQRYFEETRKKHTLKALGNKLGVSVETVRQIELRALKKLNNMAEDLRAYLYR